MMFIGCTHSYFGEKDMYTYSAEEDRSLPGLMLGQELAQEIPCKLGQGGVALCWDEQPIRINSEIVS